MRVNVKVFSLAAAMLLIAGAAAEAQYAARYNVRYVRDRIEDRLDRRRIAVMAGRTSVIGEKTGGTAARTVATDGARNGAA
jgi:hypothetical protein